ncbi:MAG TPA: hypothetical protein VIP11_26505 [Gemmatimonadaceae bacterium]
MSLDLVAMLAGVFGIPIALLLLGHRLRRRTTAWRGAFWGALVAHVVIAPVAMVAAMRPAAEWAPTDAVRGAIGFWSLLLGPALGAIVGALIGRRRTADCVSAQIRR